MRESKTGFLPSGHQIMSTKLLEAIDRGNPAGKRDYAMILLVARLGLRTIDLKRLKLENLKWQENRITLIQSKTSRELHLPLLQDVGWAIIDYLKHGRPKVDSSFVFLTASCAAGAFRRRIPFAPDHREIHEASQDPNKPPEEKRYAFFTAYAGQPASSREYSLICHLRHTGACEFGLDSCLSEG